MLNEKRKTLLLYTVFFAIGVGLIFLPLWMHHKSLLRYSDGLDQYYYTLCYIGEWLKRIVRSVFVEFHPVIPKWDLSIGLGSDIIGTLHYYGLGDPLNLLAVFVPLAHMEALYTVLVFARMYLAGLSFMAYCRYRNLPEEGLSVCALAYVFSGFMLMAGVRWVSFMWPFIAFPLILLGIDKAFREKKVLPFGPAILLAAVSGIYFFYMQTILAAVYGVGAVISKALTLRKEEPVSNAEVSSGKKGILPTILKLIATYIVALVISLPILYPVIEKLLANERVGLAIDIPRLFDTAFYKQLPLFTATICDIYNDNGIPLGVAPVVIAALVAMIFARKQKKWMWMAFLLCLAAIGLPYFSHIMNGFGYVVHRWVWVFAFTMAYLLADNWEALQKVSRLRMLLMAIVHVAFAFYLYRMMEPSSYRLCVIACVLASWIPFCLWTLPEEAGQSWLYSLLNRLRPLKICSLGMIVLFWAFINMWHVYHAIDIFSYENHVKSGSANGELGNEALNWLMQEAKSESNDLWRYDSYDFLDSTRENLNPLLHLNGTQFYYSITDDTVYDYYRDILMPVNCNYSYADMDSRLIPQSMAGVRFFAVPKESADYLPCGYEETPCAEAGDVLIYRNPHALPLGVFYDGYLDKKDWDQLNIGDKMYNQLRGCLINEPDDALKANYQSIALEQMASEENYDPERTYTSSKDEELYYVAEGISYVSDWEEAGMNVYYGDQKKHWEYKTKYSPTYIGIDSFAVQMSSGAKDIESEIGTFDDPDITVASASVVKLPLQKAYEQLDALKEHALKEITVQDNMISGKASLDHPMILQLAVPYSSHWHVTVDGEEGSIYRAGMYMAVPMMAGEHSVELAYR